MTFLLEKFIVFKMGFNLEITWYSLERARTFKCSACQIWVLQNGRGLYQQGWRQHRGQLRGEQNGFRMQMWAACCQLGIPQLRNLSAGPLIRGMSTSDFTNCQDGHSAVSAFSSIIKKKSRKNIARIGEKSL